LHLVGDLFELNNMGKFIFAILKCKSLLMFSGTLLYLSAIPFGWNFDSLYSFHANELIHPPPVLRGCDELVRILNGPFSRLLTHFT